MVEMTQRFEDETGLCLMRGPGYHIQREACLPSVTGHGRHIFTCTNHLREKAMRPNKKKERMLVKVRSHIARLTVLKVVECSTESTNEPSLFSKGKGHDLRSPQYCGTIVEGIVVGADTLMRELAGCNKRRGDGEWNSGRCRRCIDTDRASVYVKWA